MSSPMIIAGPSFNHYDPLAEREFKAKQKVFELHIQDRERKYWHINCRGVGGVVRLLEQTLNKVLSGPKIPYVAYLAEGDVAASSNANFAIAMPYYNFHPKSQLMFHLVRTYIAPGLTVMNYLGDPIYENFPITYRVMTEILPLLLTTKEYEDFKNGMDIEISGEQIMTRCSKRPIDLIL